MPKIDRVFKEGIDYFQRRTTSSEALGFNASKHENDRLSFLKRECRPDAAIIARQWNRGDKSKAQCRRMKGRPLFRHLGLMRCARVIEGGMASQPKLHAAPHDFHPANQMIVPWGVRSQASRHEILDFADAIR